MTAPLKTGAEAVAAADVVAFLRANPRFLADNPDLYRRLSPPVRVHGDILADHMVAMLRAERERAAVVAELADGVTAAGRAAAGLLARVHEAVIGVVCATSVVDFVEGDMPAMIGVDAATLLGHELRPVPAVMINQLMSTRAVVFRIDGEDRAMLHGEAAELARYDALVRVPRASGLALLALASRDHHALNASQGGAALAFLGRVIAVTLDR